MRSLPTELRADWEVQSTIGKGGQSETFLLRALSDRTPSNAVLKLRNGDSTSATERFAREVEVLRKVDHPNVVKLLRCEEAVQPCWYVMPRGVCFKRWWKDQQKSLASNTLDLFEASLRVIKGVLSGLCELHRLGYTHRDVKPDNLVVISNQPVIIDLGLLHHDRLVGLTGPEGAGNKFVTVSRSIPPSPLLDNLCVASLWIWMLLRDRKQSYGHYDWRYVQLVNGEWPYSVPVSVLATCSAMSGQPRDACQLLQHIEKVLPPEVSSSSADTSSEATEIKRLLSMAATADALADKQRERDAEGLAMSVRDAAMKIARDVTSYVDMLSSEGWPIVGTNQVTRGNPQDKQFDSTTHDGWTRSLIGTVLSSDSSSRLELVSCNGDDTPRELYVSVWLHFRPNKQGGHFCYEIKGSWVGQGMRGWNQRSLVFEPQDGSSFKALRRGGEEVPQRLEGLGDVIGSMQQFIKDFMHWAAK